MHKVMIKHPLLHFLVLGGLIFLCVNSFSGIFSSSNDSFVIDSSRVEAIKKNWLQQFGVSPTPSQLEGQITLEENEELLYREALRRNLHLSDETVKLRLLKDIAFLGFMEDMTEQQQLEAAIELELYKHDLVVKRRLVQLMEFSISDSIDADKFAEQELQQYYRENKQFWRLPANYSFKQMFFSRIEKADGLSRDIIQGRLKSYSEAGEYFQLGNDFSAVSTQKLSEWFGKDFVIQLSDQKTGIWSQPLKSPYGYHLVFIEQFNDERIQAFEKVKKQLAESLLQERRQEQLANAVDQLRQRYGESPRIVESL